MPESRSDRARAEFSRVALPHLDQVYTTALYLGGDPDRAADLVQETFLRALRFFHRFEPGTNCRAWLLTILHNTLRNRYRAELRERSQADIDDPLIGAEATRAANPGGNPETLVLETVLDAEVADALKALPENFRSAIVLVDLQDLTYEEAARALDCPIGTVRSRLSRGRTLLHGRLESYARRRGVLK
jgi:RNA polymerase sigma-70 factor (ECF subfamily)